MAIFTSVASLRSALNRVGLRDLAERDSEQIKAVIDDARVLHVSRYCVKGRGQVSMRQIRIYRLSELLNETIEGARSYCSHCISSLSSEFGGSALALLSASQEARLVLARAAKNRQPEVGSVQKSLNLLERNRDSLASALRVDTGASAQVDQIEQLIAQAEAALTTAQRSDRSREKIVNYIRRELTPTRFGPDFVLDEQLVFVGTQTRLTGDKKTSDITGAFGLDAVAGTVLVCPRFVLDYLWRVAGESTYFSVARVDGYSDVHLRAAAKLYDPSSKLMGNVQQALDVAQGIISP